jgi:predicted TIM-barrel fold metal-dependent hydrolase
MAGDAVPWLIDGHTHAFPTPWVADRSAHVRDDFWFGELYEAPSARMIDAAMLLATMDEAGVAQAVMCGWPWVDPGHCRAHNDYLAAAARASDGRLAWLGTVSPGAPEAAQEAERCFALGACGIGELNADAQGFDLALGGGLDEVVALLQAADRPLLLHASEPVGHRYPGKGTATPDRLLPFIAAHQALRIVLAHWGGGLPFYELMPEVAELTQSVAYDTAASSYLYRPAVFRTVIDIVGSDRVIWGSDHPVLGMGRFLRRTLRDSALRDDELEPLLSGNARRVYRLAEPNALVDRAKNTMTGATA